MNKFIEYYFHYKVSPRSFVFLFDLLVMLFSAIMILLFFYGTDVFVNTQNTDTDTIILVLTLFASNSVAFFIFQTYSGVLRFSVFIDLKKIVYTVFSGYFITFITLNLLNFGMTFLELLRLLSPMFFFNVFLMLLTRIIIKELYESITDETKKEVPVFIYGAQDAGVHLANSFRRSKELNYKLKGFVSSDNDMVGKKLVGVNVYEYNDQLFEVLRKKEISTIIISQKRFEDLNIKEVLESFIDNNISLLTTDSTFSEWQGNITSKKHLKEVQIEDLLPRHAININMRNIASNLEGKRVMITSAAGSIGSEIVRQVAAFNPLSLILIDQSESPLHNLKLELQELWVNLKTEVIVADVSNESRMNDIFKGTKPQYIFHAAAYKHVPMMEENVSESIQNNIQGAKIMADLAVKYRVSKFVMISTDKAVNPSNVMGTSKRICEIYVQSLAKHLEQKGKECTQFITTRFGNVLGSNGSVIPLFREQIRKGGPVTVTHPEIIRYFMTITEACQLVLEAGSLGNGGEIYLFDMGKPVKILDLAKRMIFLSGAKDIKIEFTGLRHGEKLYEELLNMEENTIKTHHDKIMIAKVQEYDYEEVSEKIDELIKVSYEYDNLRTVKKMKDLVPEFRSLNSPYEAVDRLIAKQKRAVLQ